jgi:hypothetical protein
MSHFRNVGVFMNSHHEIFHVLTHSSSWINRKNNLKYFVPVCSCYSEKITLRNVPRFEYICYYEISIILDMSFSREFKIRAVAMLLGDVALKVGATVHFYGFWISWKLAAAVLRNVLKSRYTYTNRLLAERYNVVLLLRNQILEGKWILTTSPVPSRNTAHCWFLRNVLPSHKKINERVKIEVWRPGTKMY